MLFTNTHWETRLNYVLKFTVHFTVKTFKIVLIYWPKNMSLSHLLVQSPWFLLLSSILIELVREHVGYEFLRSTF